LVWVLGIRAEYATEEAALAVPAQPAVARKEVVLHSAGEICVGRAYFEEKRNVRKENTSK
jgi:hypothetical protein